MGVRRGGRTTIANARGPRDLGLRRTELGALLLLLGRSFGLSARGFFGAQDRHTRCFRALCFGGSGLLLRQQFGRDLGGCGFRRGVLFGGGLNVGCFATPANRRIVGDGLGDRNGLGGNDGRRAATACRRRGRGLLFGSGAFFPLPPRTDASDLVVGEHAHVASDRNVHEPKKGGHFFSGDSEFVCQLTD